MKSIVDKMERKKSRIATNLYREFEEVFANGPYYFRPNLESKIVISASSQQSGAETLFVFIIMLQKHNEIAEAAIEIRFRMDCITDSIRIDTSDRLINATNMLINTTKTITKEAIRDVVLR